VIDIHRRLERLNRRRCLPELDEAAPTLLIEATEARMMTLQKRERLQPLRDPGQIPLGDCPEEQHVTVRGSFREQRLACGQRLGKLLLPQQRAYPRYFEAIAAACWRA